MGDNKYLEADKQLAFISGHWQKEMPTKVGTYPTANKQGERAEDRRIIITKGGKVYDPTSLTNIHVNGGTDWTSWWWSEPYPELPKPPEWDATVPSPIDVSGWGVVGQE